VQLILARSGGIFEATEFARLCEISRPTVTTYLGVLEATGVAQVIRPYSTRRSTEIVAAPKVYGFDTGFVCYHRGWTALRTDDLGLLWEHFVLNELRAALQGEPIHYWRDKAGHEVDFVLARRGRPPVAIECKWSAAELAVENLRPFRSRYPEGENILVAQDASRSVTRTVGGVRVMIESLEGFVQRLSAKSRPRHATRTSR
jgi:predicted AAA+ superfamily ATPase